MDTKPKRRVRVPSGTPAVGGPKEGQSEMAVVERLEKTTIPVVTDEVMVCIENLIDTAFWQLMLGDDLDTCERDVEMLCAGLRFRWAQVRVAAKEATLEEIQ